ncbi:MAG: glutamate-cysteine ligase family protein [Actinomycetales bacterium]
MGDEVASTTYTREHRQRYREKVQLCLDVFERMLAEHQMETGGGARTGLEVELNLVGDDMQPAMRNTQTLEAIADSSYQTEIGRYNIELNVPPGNLTGTAMLDLEHQLRETLNAAAEAAERIGVHIVMVGILPTLAPEHFDGDWMSPSARYEALNDTIVTFRGEDIFIDISGAPPDGERLSTFATSIAPESACTSVQLHLQVDPSEFARYWNAAQVLVAPQVALAANSPFFFGRRLWDETRVELFHQAIDVRPQELKNQGVRPRVFFGDRWITSIFDLFEENVRYFPSLLPELSDEDPVAVLATGKAPRLQELRLHNGTVYRWNRPIYDVVDGVAHLRVENRVLPAGPTVIDIMANAAFYYGCVKVLAEMDRPVWSKLAFKTAKENFDAACQSGLDAHLYWPEVGDVTVDELVLHRLLPLAHQGLREYGVDDEVRNRYLGVIEARAKTGRTGARWMTETVAALEASGMDRPAALAAMVDRYRAHMHSNDPVHTWPIEA